MQFFEVMNFINPFLSYISDILLFRIKVEDEKIRPLGVDMSIESMNTEQFSVGIFYFLIFAIIVFVIISFMFMFKDKGKDKNLKKGEKFLFIWIMFGVVVAIVFGALQMTQGYLF